MRGLVFAAVAVFGASTAAAQPMRPDEVPEPLRAWVPWVLDADETYGCTLLEGDPVCAWPGELRLVLDASGGRFELDVVADREVAVTLPGGEEHFPRDVRVDGVARPVLDGPTVRVGPGSHRIDGTLRWTTRPDILPVPPQVARVSLVLDGQPVRTPRREDTGAVWLARVTEGESAEGHFEMEVFRRLEDGAPFRVITHLAVRASGEPREMELGNALLPGMIPTDVQSDLAVRLAPDGSLSAQVHAGSFQIEVSSVVATPPESLGPPEQAEPWPPTEVWIWVAQESLRQVELEGAPSVDPTRTNLPGEWRSHPAYILGPGAALAFDTTRRGEPMPPPNSVTLSRELWLDLDGEGYTVRDALSGRMNDAFRLSLTEGRLGHAVVLGRDQLVTTVDGVDGIEIRSRALDVRAESRLPEATSDLPAVAWSEDVQSLSATLRLPPGYSLIGAAGVDEAPGTWIDLWDLWGLFFLVLVTVAIGRLFGWRWIAIALPLLVLTYHEAGSPMWSWVVLAAVAGLRTAWKKGTWGPRVLRWSFFLVLGVLVLISVPFATDQVRFALFPQVEDPSYAATPEWLGTEDVVPATVAPEPQADDGLYGAGGGDMPTEAPAPVQAGEMLELEEELDEDRAAEGMPSRELERDYRTRRVAGILGSSGSGRMDISRGWIDPNEVIQTGPGVPDWSFTTWPLRWSGPVAKDHRVKLYLVAPFMNRLLALLRVLLLGVLIVVIARHRFPRPAAPTPPTEAPGKALAAAAAALLALAGIAGAGGLARAQGLPDDARLEQLRERLMRPPVCVPECVIASSLEVRVAGDRVALDAVVSASAQAAYRIPGPTDAWVPETVTVDGRPDSGLVRRDDGFLFLRLEPGVHRVRMEGAIPTRDALTLAFGDPPRSIDVSAEGWEVEGVRADGRVSESIQLRRTIRSEEGQETDQAPLASWLVVTRRLDVGVRWTLQSTVERVTPAGQAVVVRIPLLRGESVTDAGMITEGGAVVVTLGRDDTTRTWTSVIEPREELVLEAPERVRWSETWTLACSPIWRCSTEGLSPVSHEANGMWEPTFQPWPGEELTLAFSRPEAATGQSVTIDRASLIWQPGVRMLDGTLEATIRTSSGGAQVLTLPEGARVQALTVDGASRPVQLEDGKLRLTLHPGSQSVHLTWQQPMELGAVFDPPEVDLGAPAVNARVEVRLPPDRWLLWAAGPSWGTAVLFWAYLVLVLGIAVLLARVRRSPLRLHDWILLGIGLTQIPAVAALIVVGWFFAFAHRGRTPDLAPVWFDLRQLALAFYTLVALGCLYAAIHTGLLLDPDMDVYSPGGGGARNLDWYTDRIGTTMPDVWVLSFPMWIWRLVMLAWALWLALRVIKWSRWAWGQATAGGGWKKLVTAPARRAGPAPAAPAPAPVAPAPEPPKGGDEDED